ncbi:MAG: iron donor protein CyaY [Gammaproteobacteria bacterium]|nr:MAG: iron donor protein CyaY [Gammaproteobacteria bacterium]
MNESEFNQLVDATLLAIEEAIDDSNSDIDYENSSGILTLEFDDGSKIIINRQTALLQLWVAAKSGGFHMDYNEADSLWQRADNGEPLDTLLNRLCSEQAGDDVVLSLIKA